MSDDGDAVRARQAARAEALMELERYQDALELWAQVIAADPTEARPYRSMANALWHLDRNREALAAIERALGLEESAYGQRLRALILLDLGERKEAIRAARKAIRIDPSSGRAHATLAQALLNDRSLKPALRAARRAIAIDPTDTSAWDKQGRIALALHDFDLAILSFRKILQLEPADGYHHMLLANCLFDAGRHCECVEALRGSLRIDPTNVWVLALLGYELAASGHPDEARQMRAAAERTAGDDSTRWQEFGMAGVRVKNRDDAIAGYRRAVAIDPKNGEAAKTLANLLGTCPETLAVLETASIHNPANESLLGERLSAMIELGRADEALAIGRAHRERTGSVDPLVDAILATDDAELLPEVADYIEQMPTDHEGLENRAIVALIRSDWAQAEQLYRRVLEVASNCCCSWSGLGMALVRQGKNLEEARECEQRSQRENWLCTCKRVEVLRTLLPPVDVG